jgi:uncharacterized membrane protein
MNQPPKPKIVPATISQHVMGTGPHPVVVSETVKTTTVSGPLPAPEVIAGYEKVLAGAADRIIKMAEKEQDHRHRFQDRTQTHLAILTIVGQVFAFLIAIFGVSGGIYLVKNNKPITGFSVFFTSLATIVGLFFYSRSRPRTTPPE